MARPQEFDTDQAVQSALAVFRRKGYAGASLADILAATGLSKSSLYATFDSKQGLFLRAFDLHRDQRRQVALACLRHGTAREGLQAYLRQLVADAHAPAQDGCLTLRVALEAATHDSTVRERVHSDYADLVSAIRATVRRGQVDGSIVSAQPAQTLAYTLTIGMLGLMAAAQTGLAPAVSETAVTQLMHMLDAREVDAP